MDDFSHQSTLIFYINGVKVTDENADPGMTLLIYLRRKLGLTGTKLGCGEGGCGACTVMVSKYDRANNEIVHFTVNACLAPVCSVHGMAVTTIEGIGSVRKGLHPAQERIAKAHGSQCGFCTPGIVMSMYTMLRNGVHIRGDEEELENGFQGNLCRCTGYRPILQGYKTFLSPSAGGCCGNPNNCCQANGNGCGVKEEEEVVNNSATCVKSECSSELFDSFLWKQFDPTQERIFPPELQTSTRFDEERLYFKGEIMSWYRPVSLKEIAVLKCKYPDAKIVIGNTEIGVEIKQRYKEYRHIICATHIPELNQIDVVEEGVRIGASTTLTNIGKFISSFKKKHTAKKLGVFLAIEEMLHWFAGPQIRNVAAIGGNIMTASPISDLNPIFMACKAQLTFLQEDSIAGVSTRVVPLDSSFFIGYRQVNVKPSEVLLNITVPFLKENEHLYAYKQAHRREDDISIVNAAMYVRFQPQTDIIAELRLCYGGMAPTTVLANSASSNDMVGKQWNDQTCEEILSAIQSDFPLKLGTPGGSEMYRMSLSLSLFYRFYLTVAKKLSKTLTGYVLSDNVTKHSQSAVGWIPRHPSSATALYEMVPAEQSNDDPVGRPMIHTSALKQSTGEALYTDDIPHHAGEVYMALVMSQRAHAKVVNVDYSGAVAMSGVVGYVDERDVPPHGTNLYATTVDVDEKIFAAGEVTCRGMVIGAVVADTQEHAQRAARAVKVTYEDLPEVITIEDAIKAKSFHHIRPKIQRGDVAEAFKKAKHVVEGEVRMAGQEHFYLETQAIFVKATEEGEVEVLSSCQNHAQMQKNISDVLGLPQNCVTVRVKRLGGGFGGKETRWCVFALPAVICAHKFKRPVRCMLDRDEDMLITGTRHPGLLKYKVGFNDEGRVSAFAMTIYLNAGNTTDLSAVVLNIAALKCFNAYDFPNVCVEGINCMTNLASNTAFRGFGMPQGLFGTETALLHVADKLGISPERVRVVNMVGGSPILPYGFQATNVTVQRCWEEVLKISDFKRRRVECDNYNKTSRWKKRGIAAMPLMYGVSFDERFLNQAGALVLIYRDGSILLSHGGNEMGQGLHVKMIQVASRALNVSPDKFHITETSTDKVPNTTSTAASFSTDLNGRAIMDACKKLNQRLKPIKDANPTATWEEIVSKAYFSGLSLMASGFYIDEYVNFDHKTGKGRPFAYYTYGAAVSEVEIDCLTGDHVVRSSDLIMDLGKSLNPAIDIGQMEGGFMQGYGLFVLEEPRISPKGAVYTRGPGTYKIPGFRDIPERLNVHLLKGSYCEHPKSVYSSKAVGEPPLLLAFSVFLAIRDAIKAARAETGLKGYFRLDSPASAERIRLACQDQFTKRLSVAGMGPPWDVQV